MVELFSLTIFSWRPIDAKLLESKPKIASKPLQPYYSRYMLPMGERKLTNIKLVGITDILKIIEAKEILENIICIKLTPIY